MAKGAYADATVVVPTYNEGRNIRPLLRELQRRYPGISVIIADDGSRDGTREAVRQAGRRNPRIRLLDRGRKPVHGLTASVVDGILAARTPYAVVMDGDLQHPPERVAAIIQALRDGADVAVGTRAKVMSEWPLHRKAMSWGATALGWARLAIGGAPFARDVMSGFFGTRTRLFQEHARRAPRKFEPRGYKVLFDYLKLLPRRTRVAPVQYVFGLRKGGESKIRMKHILLYLKSLLK
jgi:dolichol-phosphate mannosyltransferase